MLNSLLQDGVSNNAGQLVIETVPVQGADCWANSLCAEAGSNVFFTVSQERSVWKVLHNLAQCQVVRCRPDPEHSQAHPVSECKNMPVPQFP